MKKRTAWILSISLTGLYLLFLALQLLFFAPPGISVRAEHPSVPVDARIELNTASEKALQDLYGIGPGLAGAIVQWREENGGFTSVDELLSVPGIGEKTFDAIRDYIYIEEETIS